MDQEILRRLDEVEARLKRSHGKLKRGLREQGREVQEGFAEVRKVLERQEMRFGAWLEGVEARLDEYQGETDEALGMLGGILRTYLHQVGQETEQLQHDVDNVKERLRRLEERDRPPAA